MKFKERRIYNRKILHNEALELESLKNNKYIISSWNLKSNLYLQDWESKLTYMFEILNVSTYSWSNWYFETINFIYIFTKFGILLL
jgi:hypothetical protein